MKEDIAATGEYIDSLGRKTLTQTGDNWQVSRVGGEQPTVFVNRVEGPSVADSKIVNCLSRGDYPNTETITIRAGEIGHYDGFSVVEDNPYSGVVANSRPTNCGIKNKRRTTKATRVAKRKARKLAKRRNR